MPVDPNDPSERKRRNLTFAAVAVFGVAALVLGFLQLLSSIRTPLRVNQPATSLLSDEDVQRLGDLRQKDTDVDGISDYEELYTYKTSPYLNDSDSDRVDDRTEIQGGTDPNCPQGATCGAIVGTPTNAANASPPTNGNTNAVPSGFGTTNVSAQTLRQTLKNAGVPQAQLDGLDDATLLKLYGEALRETPTQTNATSPSNVDQPSNISNLSLLNLPANATISQEALQNLSAADIRQLLIQAGVEQQTLQNIDDVTLRAIFLQAIEGGQPQP